LALPTRPLPTDTVDVFGEAVTVRGLSRAEAIKVTTQYDAKTADDAEAFIVAKGTSVTEAEAKEWLAATEQETAGRLVDRILELSNLKEQVDKDGNSKDPK
jgi:hypothetical protein